LFKILRDAICLVVTGAFLPANIIDNARRLTRVLIEPPRTRTRRPFPDFVVS
jgi:hypothetical protein